MSRPELDPRTKLLLSIGFTAVIVASRELSWLAAELAVLAAVVVLLGLGAAWLRTLRLLAVMTAAAVVIAAVSFGLVTALVVCLRWLGIATAFFLFFQTTLPEELGDSLVKMGMPYALAFIFSSSMQFVPVIARRAHEVMDAQRSRGIRLEGDLASLRNYPALLGPLLLQSFKLSDELAEAMESRGFGSPRRTLAKDYRLGLWDWVVLGVVTVVFLTLWVLG